MKILGIILLLASASACDPYGFGFKKNPSYVLNEAFKAIENLDRESFVKVTAKEGLCVYGNERGLAYLKDNIQLNVENIEVNPKLLESRHYPVGTFVGFWSYYHERYEIEVKDKSTQELLLETIVDCEFGIQGEKDDSLINMMPSNYKKKDCRATKLLPKKFNALPVPARCELLKVEL